jgi:hypothetical protein
LRRPLGRTLALAPLALGACVVVPVTTQVYDQDCHIEAHHMEMSLAQVGGIARCEGQGCVALLAAAGAVTAASAVVSGSIVVTGNIVYWFEKQGRCHAEALPPAP